MGMVWSSRDWRVRSEVRRVRTGIRHVNCAGVRDWRREERDASTVSMRSSRTWRSNAVFIKRIMA